MPVALDPDEVFEYIICTDRVREGDREKPTLLFHFPTVRELRKVAQLFDDAEKKGNEAESFDLRCDAVRVLLVGWRHFRNRDGDEIPYEPENLDLALSDLDLTELQTRMIKEMTGRELEKKSTALRALSNPAGSALAAAEPAATNPAKIAPSSLNAPNAEEAAYPESVKPAAAAAILK